jgi:hypothetical protein
MTWFMQWVYEPNHPVYQNTYNFTNLGGGNWMVGFRARQTQTNAPYFKMPIELRVTFSSGPDTLIRVMNTVNDEVYGFVFNRQPLSLQFDPGNNIVIKQGTTSAGMTVSAPVLVWPANGATDQPLAVELRWNEVVSAATYRLQVATDTLFGAIVYNDSTITDTARQVGPLAVNTQYYWRLNARNAGGTSAWSTRWGFRTAAPETVVFHFAADWNMISLPLLTDSARMSTLFPTAAAWFAYDPGTGYHATDTLIVGQGYWLKFNSAQDVPVIGSVVLRDTIAVQAGWNLIGSITDSVPTSSITTIPPGLISAPIYGFDATYVAADAIVPTKGYWVKVAVPGQIVLSGGTLRTNQARTRFSK